MLDENGKLFGLINPVDLGVILVVFAVSILLIRNYLPKPLNLKENHVTYGILVRNVPAYVSDGIALQQEMVQDPQGIYLGVIYAKKSQPAMVMLNDNGRLQLVRAPENVDLRLELRRKARIITGPSQYGVFVDRLPLRIGASIKAHTLTTQINGEIEYLKVQNDGNRAK